VIEEPSERKKVRAATGDAEASRREASGARTGSTEPSGTKAGSAESNQRKLNQHLPSEHLPSGQQASGQQASEDLAGEHSPDKHQAGAAFLRKRGANPRRAAAGRRARNAWTGAVALAVTGGVLVSASASAPTSGTVASGSAASNSVAGAASSMATSRAGTDQPQAGLSGLSQDALAAPAASMGVTVSQVLAVLNRAERTLRQRDSSLSPNIAQAAAELGMLYTTYQAQQLALAQADDPLRIDTAPAAGKASTREVADAPVSAERASSLVTERAERSSSLVTEKAEQVSSLVTEQAERGPAQPTQTQTQTQTQTLPASARTACEKRLSSRPRTEAHGPGYVTFDEVAVAAMRLANMLDPSSPTALIETLPDAGTSLRRNLLETVAAYGSSTVGYANGRIPADVLCPLDFAPGHLLRCDAAERLTALSARFEREFGYPIPLTDSYRSYETQIAVRDTKPHLAAIPGTSNHGWGLAIDLDDPIAGGSSPEYVWLRLHAPDYGWDNPSWAQLGGAKPEPWHFEFFAAGSIPNRAISPSDVGTWAPTGAANPDFLSTAAQRRAGDGPASGASTGNDGAHAATGGSSGRTEPAPEPPATTPSEPAPSEPPTEGDPDDTAPGDIPPTDPGLVEDVLAGTDELVDGTVEGVVGSVVGGLLDSGGVQTDSPNRTTTKTTDTD
jgi:hypothetical protein